MIMGPGVLRNLCLGLLAGTAVVALATSAKATPCIAGPTVLCSASYYGGDNTYNGANVIGNGTFNITEADFSRTNGGNTLHVVIYTGFAGAPQLNTSEGTGYGSLFFQAPNTTYGTAGNPPIGSFPYPNDVYTPGEWNYALATNFSTGAPTGLYAIAGGAETKHDYDPSGSDNYVLDTDSSSPLYNQHIADYYTTSDGGKIVMSNVNGDPASYPFAHNPGYYFRTGQAVQYIPYLNQAALGPGGSTVTIVNHVSITYDINDNGALGNSFAVAWAMTCANDVVQGIIQIPGGGNQNGVPGPIAGAGLPGLLFAGGFFGWWRKRRMKNGSAAVATV